MGYTGSVTVVRSHKNSVQCHCMCLVRAGRLSQSPESVFERRLSPDYSSSCTVLFHPLIVEDVLPVLLQQLPFVPPEDSPSFESNCYFSDMSSTGP